MVGFKETLSFSVFTVSFSDLRACCTYSDVCRGRTRIEWDSEGYLTDIDGGVSGGGDGEGKMAVDAVATV
jgi:hypothetical protein